MRTRSPRVLLVSLGLALAGVALASAPVHATPTGGTAPAGYGLLQAARRGAYLRLGSRGLAVAALQRALARAGVNVPQTGVFDPPTAVSVRRFQTGHGASADGVVGPRTLAALDRALGVFPNGIPPQGTNIPAPPGYRPIRGAVPAAVTTKAVEVLHRPEPIGAQMEIAVNGRAYVFAVEWHRHAATDPVPDRLKRWHRGVTVYER